MFAACLGFPSNISVIFSASCLVIICFNPYTDLFHTCIENINLAELSSIKSGILILALAGSRWLAEGVNFCYSRYKKSCFYTIIISSHFLILSAKSFTIRLDLLLFSITLLLSINPLLGICLWICVCVCITCMVYSLGSSFQCCLGAKRTRLVLVLLVRAAFGDQIVVQLNQCKCLL